jgi:hypothetical protein
MFRFRLKKYSNNQVWLNNLENAFNYCLIGRWFLFNLKESNEKKPKQSATIVANNIQFEPGESDFYVSVYQYLREQAEISKQLEFSNSFILNESNCSIVDNTFNENENDPYEEDILTQRLTQISLKEGLTQSQFTRNPSFSSLFF